ncbi:hypothetical protein [Microbulbifer sp. JSM ZJ756]|uniref:hypothetical protein n=1 Tax=Microbulbifer sp. JSM ZJ756 TaxID=3376191 RepID=UPI0037A8F44A
MATLLVTYDLNRETKRPPMLQAIKELANGNWAKLSESSYAIRTNLNAAQVLNALTPFIDQNDNIYIINLKAPWNGFGPQEVNAWLENALR